MGGDAEVVQARPGTTRERDVVGGLLAVQPGRVQLVLVTLDGLGAAEAEGLVVGVGGRDVRVHMFKLQAGDRSALVQVVALDEALGVFDLVEELDGEVERVGDAYRVTGYRGVCREQEPAGQRARILPKGGLLTRPAGSQVKLVRFSRSFLVWVSFLVLTGSTFVSRAIFATRGRR
ncbi:hypothetical protein ACWCQQ_38790 [Streptomyces sp. NPDC002143]